MWASVRQGFWVLLDRFGRIWAILISAAPLVAAYFSAIPENMPCSCGVGSTPTSPEEIDHGKEASNRPQRRFLAPAAAHRADVGGREAGGRGTKPPTAASLQRTGLSVTANPVMHTAVLRSGMIHEVAEEIPPMSKGEMDREAGDQPQPIVLTRSKTKQVAGGMNPQPLPPGENRPSARTE